MDRASRVRVRGPLEAYASGFVAELIGLGYAGRSAQTHLVLMAHLSCWLDDGGLDVGCLTSVRADEFLAAQLAAGRRFPRSIEGLVPLLEHLRSVGAAPAAEAMARSPHEELVERFSVYLACERGLTAGTIVGYRLVATLFVAALEDGGLDPEQVTSADVSGFVLAECEQRSVGSAKNLVTGLRAFLRFMHVEGITAASLSGAVPAVAGWCSGLPLGIDAGSVKRLRASCDRRTVKGRRDFAILMLLSRVGMRAGEVAALEVGDVDWRAGERGAGQGQPAGASPRSCRCRGGSGRLCPSRSAPQRAPSAVPAGPRPAPAPDGRSDQRHRPRRLCSCRTPADRDPSPASHGRDRASRSWGRVGGDRAGVASQEHGHDRHLRQGRHRRAQPARSPVAGSGA